MKYNVLQELLLTFNRNNGKMHFMFTYEFYEILEWAYKNKI